ncbi:MAG TPA: YpdA family putative bacillithiol disulfide reductase [Bacillota bacterium]
MLDLLIIGAGPCGLAVAACAQRSGLDYLALDKGCIVDSLTRYPTNMTFFSTSDRLAIAGIPFITRRPNPTREEAMEYYRQVAATLGLAVRTYERVVAVEREADGFRVIARPVLKAGAVERVYQARALVVATGSFDHPNRLGIPGEDSPKASHYFTEAHRFYGQRVLVVGGRNSAVEAALELYRAGAEVTLVHRGPTLSDRVKPWLLPFIHKRLEEGAIASLFSSRLVEIGPESVIVETDGRRWELANDYVFILTGYRPDHSLLRSLGVEIDAATGAPRHDPETMETNVPGLYIAGVIAAGYDANAIFIENGRFHGERIVGHLLERRRAGAATGRAPS